MILWVNVWWNRLFYTLLVEINFYEGQFHDIYQNFKSTYTAIPLIGINPTEVRIWGGCIYN